MIWRLVGIKLNDERAGRSFKHGLQFLRALLWRRWKQREQHQGKQRHDRILFQTGTRSNDFQSFKCLARNFSIAS